MRNVIKRTLAYLLSAAMLIPVFAYAEESYCEDANPEVYILASRGGGDSVTGETVENVYNNLNRCSPLALWYKDYNGRGAYYVHSNYPDTMQVECQTPTLMHRIMADKSYKSFETKVSDFENSVIKFSISAAANYSKILPDSDGDKSIKFGLAHTLNDGSANYRPTEVKYVSIKHYGDLAAVGNDKTKYFDFAIPVKDILKSDDFAAINNSTESELKAEDINAFVFAIDHPDPASNKSSSPIFYFADVRIENQPNPVQNLNYTSSSDTAELTWDASESGNAKYNIFRDGQYISTVSQTYFTDYRLSPDTDYVYGIQVQSGLGTSAAEKITARTKNYFDDPPLLAATFSNISIDGSPSLKDKCIKDGNTQITGTLKSNLYEGGAAVAAVYIKDGKMTDIDVDILDSLEKGDFSLSLDTEIGGEVRFFAVDSLESLTLLSQLAVLNDDGFFEIKIEPAADKASEIKAEFDSTDSGFFVSNASLGGAVIMAYPDETDPKDITKQNVKQSVAYLFVTDSSATAENPVKIVFNDKAFDDGKYLFALTTAANEVNNEPIGEQYAKPETILGIYSSLNSGTVTVSQAISCVETPILNLDLTDFNRVSKEAAMNRFLEIKPYLSGVSDIKDTLDKAVGTVLFCSAVPKNDLDVKKYASIIGLDAGIANELTSLESNSEVKAYAYRLMTQKSSDTINNENAAKLFKDCYVSSLASNRDNTWQMLKAVIEKYNIADFSEIPSYIDESDVFKAMLGKDYSSADEIKSEYAAAVKSAKESYSSKRGNGGGGGGKSGSSASPVPVYVPDDNVGSRTAEEKNYRTFTDLPKTHWAYDSVENLVDKKIISKATIFRPEDTVTREEFVKMIAVSLGLVANSVCGFDDVPGDSWYAPYINAAFSQGVATGISQTSFGVGANITRQDMAVMLYRALGKVPDEVISDYVMNFEDNGEIADYAQNAVRYLSKINVINGDTSSRVRPNDFATRAESAKMICSFLDFVNSSR